MLPPGTAFAISIADERPLGNGGYFGVFADVY